ncbi:MAG: TetR family transcriptional regulator [Pseudonocardiaceae bacterium]|nr:TetR family transcriptional regulator [Pseudonocardiaceae bacterium]
MARSTPGVTRQRILAEAIRLFSTRGYGATTVAEIQVACGLTAGSGALYKHFPSKKALLEHAVREHVDTMARKHEDAATQLPEDPREALRLIADTVWEVIETDRDLIRIMLREFDGFAELFEQMWQGVLANLYRQCTAWIAAQRELGTVDVADPEATTAVLIGSLTYYPLLEAMIGHSPGDVEPERFRTAWLDHAAGTLKLDKEER